MGDKRSKTLGLALLAVAGLAAVTFFAARSPGPRGHGDGSESLVARAPSGMVEVSTRETSARAPALLDSAPESAPETATEHGSAAPATPAARLSVTGRVVDEAGAPIEGAEVLEWSYLGTSREIARTEASGRFVGEVVQDHWLAFCVLASGHARVELPYTSRERGSLDLGTIVLAPGGEVQGRVRDGGGRVPVRVLLAVAPASLHHGVELAEELTRESFGDNRIGSTTEIAVDGSFHLRGLPVGEWFVWAEAPGGYGWSSRFQIAPGTRAEVEVVVPSADESFWISGRVLGPERRPLAGVQLSLLDSPGLDVLGWGNSATSAGDGGFLFELDEPGVFLLGARDPELRGAAREGVQVASGQRDLELVLPPLPWIDVRLVDERGKAIAWGNVWGAGAAHVPLTPLGESGVGRIPFEGLELRLEADAPGFMRAKFGPYGPDDVARGLELVLVPGGFVRGRITCDGRAVRGARLDLATSHVPGESRASRGTTPDGWPFGLTNHVQFSGDDGKSDGDGRFTLSIPNAGWHALRVEAEGYPLTLFGPWELDPARPSPELELALERGGALEGRVLLPPGESPLGRFVGVSNGWSFAHTTAVDAEGRYRFANLAPGACQVRPVEPPVAALQGLEPAWEEGAIAIEPDVVVPSGGTARFDLDCTTSRGWAVSGRFRFEGVELAAWWATLGIPASDGEIPVAQSPLATDGSFRLVTWKPGRYVLAIGCEQSTFRRPIELLSSETRVDLAYSAAWVEIPPGEPSDREKLTVVQIGQELPEGGEFLAWSWACNESRWRVAVPAGRVGVHAYWRGQEGPARSEPVELRAGEERELALPRKPSEGGE